MAVVSALSTSNLPDPGVDPNASQEPRDYFETFLYTGNGTGLQVGDVIKKPADTTTISNSLVFDDGSSTDLSGGVPGTASSTYTLSMWFKRATITSGSYQYLFYTHSNGGLSIGSTAGQVDEMYVYNQGGGDVQYLGSGRKIKDTSKWYHVVMKVSSNSATVYLDGVQLGTATAGTVTSAARIGSYNGSLYFDGYLAEIHFVDGTAHEPTDFGNFDANGIWIPKAVTGITYGTNGFYLDFSDNTSTTTLGEDQTANGNDWTLNNFATTDQVTDSPTNNFATLNPSTGGSSTTSEGNLRANIAPVNGSRQATIAPRTGKWYAEVTPISIPADYSIVGVGHPLKAGWNSSQESNPRNAYWTSTGLSNVVGWTQIEKTVSGTFSTSNVIGIALDVDNSKVEFFKDGVSAGYITFDTGGEPVTFMVAHSSGSNTGISEINFGQRAFAQTPPTGYLALSENNITVDDQNLESPDFVWIKNRDTTDKHHWYDSVRGVQKALYSSSPTTAQTDEPNGLLDFNKNGFTVGSEVEVNTSGEDYVAWCWKANGTGVSNTNGATSSTVSANTTAGFSIVKWTPTSSSATTVGHGLSQKPDMIIYKRLEDSYGWIIGHSSLPNSFSDRLLFNSDPDSNNNSSPFNLTEPTASVMTIGTYSAASGKDHIAYVFHSVEGFSKFGSYTGNNSTNGPFVYTGFRPAFLIVKTYNTTGSWVVRDAKRDDGHNDGNITPFMYADATTAEGTISTSGRHIDFLSNGFKVRENLGITNSTNSFIYMAFAETPFKYATAR